MKVVLFCGGFGTRLREYSDTIPKPLVNVGNRPILWNLMRYYAHQGHREFILCLGYRGDLIREFFLNYNHCLASDFRLKGQDIELFEKGIEEWDITFVDTGLASNIGERLQAVRPYLEGEEYFLANYSDGLSDVPMSRVIDTMKSNSAVAAFVSVKPSNSLSMVESEEGFVTRVDYLGDSVYINGGFFALSQKIFDYMEPGDELVEEPFQRLIRERKLVTYRHDGFWRAMDTFKDKKAFDDMCEKDQRPWETWRR